MIVDITIHGDRRLLEARLDFGDLQPAVGWEIDLDYTGQAVINSIMFSSPRLVIQLLPPANWNAEEAVALLSSEDFPEWTDVQLGDHCYCPLCPNSRER